jgi:hypothetical protein
MVGAMNAIRPKLQAFYDTGVGKIIAPAPE